MTFTPPCQRSEMESYRISSRATMLNKLSFNGFMVVAQPLRRGYVHHFTWQTPEELLHAWNDWGFPNAADLVDLMESLEYVVHTIRDNQEHLLYVDQTAIRAYQKLRPGE